MNSARDRPVRAARGLVRGTGSLTGLAVAVAVGFGIPLAWIWIASQIAGTKRELTPSLAILITTGILVSYWLALLVGSRLRRRWVGEAEERARQRHMSWNRSFRDQPLSAANRESDPIERIFVVVALLGIIAFEVWFFFFAGSPLPNQPAF
jgi:4-amino-4-deoxy-L-arabinose transferase-like glycosyltransferase